MSTAPETEPVSVEPEPGSAPPFYRRPLVLIVAGAVVLMLIVGGILTAVTLLGTRSTVHPAAGSTSRPTSAASTPIPTPTATATPTPTASATEPQAGAPAKSGSSGTAPVAPVAPVAPAPAPAPPVSAGPPRTSGPTITEFKVIGEGSCHSSGPTPGKYYPIVLEWQTSGATSATMTIRTESTTGSYTTTTVSDNTQGPENFNESCTLTQLVFKLTVTSGTGLLAHSATQSVEVHTPY